MTDKIWCRREDCQIERLHPEHDEDFDRDRESFGDPVNYGKRGKIVTVPTALPWWNSPAHMARMREKLPWCRGCASPPEPQVRTVYREDVMRGETAQINRPLDQMGARTRRRLELRLQRFGDLLRKTPADR